MKKTTFEALALLALLSSACGTPQTTEDVESCEHMAAGPAVAVTAVAAGDGAEVAADHQRYDIALGAETRSVHFAASEAEDYRFALSRNVPLTLTDASGNAIAIEETQTSNTGCSEVAVVYTAALPVGTATLTFGGTDASVSLVVEHAAHSHDHE